MSLTRCHFAQWHRAVFPKTARTLSGSRTQNLYIACPETCVRGSAARIISACALLLLLIYIYIYIYTHTHIVSYIVLISTRGSTCQTAATATAQAHPNHGGARRANEWATQNYKLRGSVHSGDRCAVCYALLAPRPTVCPPNLRSGDAEHVAAQAFLPPHLHVSYLRRMQALIPLNARDTP